ncbi:hypothetical protein [Synechococcus sp. PCC 6312]|uniref:hypothetical protein n=1 Tax=Synechococcus sp. (strain ATCC 27167 / PCC 6312) TaxID=195253 RepID=UPI00029F2E47|nr:hypothetical protein [Synechococcus sp. PCC 6312]AFY61183.1 hypothetical protein Syn6312_2052 [Synechococcus sp. PCC 6312]
MATSLHSLLAELREAATSNRDMGDRFERLVFTFLKNDPLDGIDAIGNGLTLALISIHGNLSDSLTKLAALKWS